MTPALQPPTAIRCFVVAALLATLACASPSDPGLRSSDATRSSGATVEGQVGVSVTPAAERTRLENGILVSAIQLPSARETAIHLGFRIPFHRIEDMVASDVLMTTLFGFGPDTEHDTWIQTIEDLGATIAWYGTSVTVTMPPEARGVILDALGRIVDRDSPDRIAFAEVLEADVESGLVGLGTGAEVAFAHLEAISFGSLHVPDLLDRAEVTADDVDRLFRDWIRPDLTSVSVVSSDPAEAVLADVASVFGRWNKEGPAVQETSESYEPGMLSRVVEMPGLEQSYVAAALPLATFGWEGWLEAKLLSGILGGSGNSRLFRKLRVEGRLSYAPSTSVNYSVYGCAGGLQIFANTDPGNAGQVLELIEAEIDEMGRSGVSEEEVEIARGQLRLVDAIPPSELASLASLQMLCGPEEENFLESLAAVEEITREALTESASISFRSDRLREVLISRDPDAEGTSDAGAVGWHYLDSLDPAHHQVARRVREARREIAGGRPEAALAKLDEIPAEHANRALVALVRGSVLATLGRGEKARDVVERAIAANPYSLWAHTLLANIHFILLGDAEATLATLDRVDAIHPRIHGAAILRARALAALGQNDAASSELERAAALQPDVATSWSAIAEIRSTALGDFDGAEVALERALELDPNDAWALQTLGDLSIEHRREATAAIGAYERLVAVVPDDGAAHARLGNALTLASRHEEAIRALERSVELAPELAWAWRRLGDVYNDELKQFEPAIAAYERATRADPTDAASWAYLGDALANAGRPVEATEKLEKAVSLDRANAWTWGRRLGDLYHDELKNFEPAIVAYRLVTDARPSDATAWGYLADALRSAEHYDEAVDALEKATTLSPDYAWAWHQLGNIHNNHFSDYRSAAEAYGRASELNPKSATVWAFLGNALGNDGHPEEAVEKLEHALELDPDYAWAWRTLGRIYNDDLKDYPAAVLAHQRVVSLTPDDARAVARLGNSLKNAGRAREAETRLRRAVELDPQYAWAWRRLGEVRNDDLKDYPAAVRAFEAAVAASPDEALLWANLGNSLNNANRPSEAVEKLERSVELKPDYVWAWRKLGYVYNDKLKDFPAAVRAHERAASLTPEDARAIASLGNSLKNAGRAREAEEQLTRAVELDPQFAWAWRRLGDVRHEDLKDHAGAVLAFEAAVGASPEEAILWASLGAALADAERPEEAVEKLERSVELDPSYSWAWMTLGVVHRDGLKDLPAAEEAFEQHAELEPASAKAWHQLGETRQRLDRNADATTEAIERAIDAYQRMLDDDPQSASLRNDIAWLIATQSTVRSPEQLDRAVMLARRACEITDYEDAAMLDTLAEVHFQRRELPAAIEMIEKAIALGGLDPDYTSRQLERFRQRDFATEAYP